MLARRIIPCLDVRDGRVVKGVRFQGLVDSGDPVALSRAYQEQGADELVLLDVSATPDGRATAIETVAAVRDQLAIPLTVGGGVRTVGDAGRLLDHGADKVGINTMAVQQPAVIGELAQRFGSQCTLLAVDAAAYQDGRPGWEVVIRSGKERTGLDAVEWCRRAEAEGAGEILLTSWDRDGTRSGYDTALLSAVCEAVHLPVIASGGADSVDHMLEALTAGADAVLAASIFHSGEYTVQQVRSELLAAKAEVRP